MADPVQKAFCVLEFNTCRSVITVQRRFRRRYQQAPPNANNIRRWHRQFEETGCLCKGKSTGRPRVSAQNVDRIRLSFERSPRKSTYEASRELQMPQTTVWRALKQKLNMKPYVIQIVQELKPEDYVQRTTYATALLEAMEDETFAARLIFSDEATFHISGKVNRHNIRIWGTEKPSCVIEHQRDSPKVNVCCAMSAHKVYGPFFFIERSVSANIYLDMLEQWLMPQLDTDSTDYIYQQDGAPPHWGMEVRTFLNQHLPHRWIGRHGHDDAVFCSWPPRSPDLTPLDFFLWGYVKDLVYVPPLPKTIPELKLRISNALASVTPHMLQNVWREMDYRLDIVRVTKGSHIEHL